MFRPATDADMPALAALMNRAYRGSGPDAGWSSEAAYRAGDRTTPALLRAEAAAAPHAATLVWPAPDGDGPLGCVRLEPLGDGRWYLGSLAVDPARQAGGAGRMLLAAAEDWVGARGGTQVRMTVVNIRSALIAWYERRGYRRTGETEPFPYDDDRFGTPLRDDLAFVVLAKDLGSRAGPSAVGGGRSPSEP